jgi:hypothetical protein
VSVAERQPTVVRPRGPGRPRRARKDVELQRQYDVRRDLGWEHCLRRQDAVAEARAAVGAGEAGAEWALRQALIDAASAAEELAAGMRAPTIPNAQVRGQKWRAAA